ncbi:hypothetical protein SISNIDRAFT_494346 [Sistotremastrum niveocremeum HHB9708]|uniref:Histone chaperone RTT106/FACT complex subunit SPT16-like middle domain-containing protein n=1 Tax=Sistotremastrum niveocremeum HHB9708 TaxID=1314777 RepID=A0A164WVV9_9AGAM|nr:hypothetical protein SISNIDRAFT_494346 [Sistotremastrum niveocremeum HHB9708]
MSLPPSVNYFDELSKYRPSVLKTPQYAELASTPGSQNLLENILRFVLGDIPAGTATENGNAHQLEEWRAAQESFKRALQNLNGPIHVRAREDDAVPGADNTNGKKAKLDSGDEASSGGDSEKLFTLHAISVTSPIRKKVDITVTTNSIIFTNQSSGDREASVTISSYDRAFLLPTPKKPKPSITVVLYSDTKPAEQVIFAVDATSTAPLKTTSFPNNTPVSETHPKGTQTEPLFRRFLSHLSTLPLIEHNAAHFVSQAGLACIDCYKGAKDGHLYFFKQGVLFGEKKPCEFIPVVQLQSVWTVSPSGRNFTIALQKRSDVAGDDVEEDEDDTGGGAITEFSLIEGKEMDVVTGWIRRHEKFFGNGKKSKSASASTPATEDEAPKKLDKGKGKATDADMEEDDLEALGEESDDEDFQADSDSDGGSPSSGSSNEDSDGGGDDDDADDEDTEDQGDDADGPLDEALHPLLRPGAMPKMSKAAMDMVVDMVEEDLGAGSSAKGKGKRKEKAEVESEEDDAGSNYSL